MYDYLVFFRRPLKLFAWLFVLPMTAYHVLAEEIEPAAGEAFVFLLVLWVTSLYRQVCPMCGSVRWVVGPHTRNCRFCKVPLQDD